MMESVCRSQGQNGFNEIWPNVFNVNLDANAFCIYMGLQMDVECIKHSFNHIERLLNTFAVKWRYFGAERTVLLLNKKNMFLLDPSICSDFDDIKRVI